MSKTPIAMILSAGFGTRLLPLTEHRPKTIMEIGVKPAIYYLLKICEDCGIKEVIINLHYFSEQTREVVSAFELKLEIFFIYEEVILGTAGAIRNAMQNFDFKNRDLVVMHGDIICDIDLSAHINSSQFCTLICATDQTIDGYIGSVGVDSNNNIIELGKFFQSNKIPEQKGFFTGIHILSAKALEFLKLGNQSCLVSEVYRDWLNQGLKIFGCMLKLYYADLGSPERLLGANLSLFDAKTKFRHIKELSGKHGGIIKGAGVIIEDGAVIGPRVILGDNSIIKSGAHVKNSLIMSRTVIDKDERLDCVIALSNARIEIDNLRLGRNKCQGSF